jgi:DNA-directed RNA polymerase specialized sigma24 family protein
MSESAAHTAIEAVARNSYGRLIAYLAARSGDVAGAEDALGDAFVTALERWPADGIPQKPEAWLLHVARNRVIDAVRRNQVRLNSEQFLQQIPAEAKSVAVTEEHFPDERLKLLFVCAHPAIEVAARTPLMLQTVPALTPLESLLRSWFLRLPWVNGLSAQKTKYATQPYRFVCLTRPNGTNASPLCLMPFTPLTRPVGKAWWKAVQPLTPWPKTPSQSDEPWFN